MVGLRIGRTSAGLRPEFGAGRLHPLQFSPMHRLILASASPRRRALLASMGLAFDVAAADIDEQVRAGEAPVAYAQRVAREKAEAVAGALHPAAGRVIGADTVVVLDGEILGKPATPEVARDYLRRLRGRRHWVITAVAVVDAAAGAIAEGWAVTDVWMRAYGDAEIDAYIVGGDPMDKAGAYAIQHPEFSPVAWLQGSEANVLGLPVALVEGLLSSFERGEPVGQPPLPPTPSPKKAGGGGVLVNHDSFAKPGGHRPASGSQGLPGKVAAHGQ
jgi:septum formation protein